MGWNVGGLGMAIVVVGLGSVCVWLEDADWCCSNICKFARKTSMLARNRERIEQELTGLSTQKLSSTLSTW